MRVVLTARAITVGKILEGLCKAEVANSSLEINPASMGNPTIDNDPTENPMPAKGLRYPAPRRLRKSFLSPDTS